MAKHCLTKNPSLIDAYCRAANTLSVDQIYLYDNPPLKKPLTKEHVKPWLLGHRGTTPGLNFIYIHLNRMIAKHDLDMLDVTGPGTHAPTSRGPSSSVRCTRAEATGPGRRYSTWRVWEVLERPGRLRQYGEGSRMPNPGR